MAAAAACGGGSHEPGHEGPAATPVDVRVVTAVAREVADVFEAGGVVQARTTATVASRILAPVREVHVKPGDRVRRGQVLVVLDDRDLSAAARQAQTARDAANEGTSAALAEIEGAKAALALAKSSYDRIAGLRQRNSATAHEMDEATASLRAAESRLSSAEARLRQARLGQASAAAASEAAGITASFAAVVAPFDGLVTEKLVEPGNMVAPGTPLVRIDDTGGFRLLVRVDESRAGHVKTGSQVPVVLDRADGTGTQEVTSTVEEVGRAVDADARAFTVKLALPDASVRSGMFGRAKLPGASRRALAVPASAVVRQGQVTSVFVVEDNAARLRMLHLGPASGQHVEVLAGLSEGERVVDAPAPGMADGRPVKVAGATAPSGGAR
jgi:multidrug efflux pump subunit AcrA (membrane-fusion protein)